MVILDVAIVNIALPSIKTDLGLLAGRACQWGVSAYAIIFGGASLLLGRNVWHRHLLGRRAECFIAGPRPCFAASSHAYCRAQCPDSPRPGEAQFAFRAGQGSSAARCLAPACFFHS